MRGLCLVLALAIGVAAAPARASANDIDARLAAACEAQGNDHVPYLLSLAHDLSFDEYAGWLGTQAYRTCVMQVSPSRRGGPQLLLVSLLGRAAAMWVDPSDRWRAIPIDVGRPLAYRGGIVSTHDRGSAKEALVALGCACSGAFASAVVLRDDGDGWREIARTPVYEQARIAFLDADHVVVTGRNQPRGRAFAWDSNCCIPGGYQWLWKRSGAAFELVAERQAPTAYLAASLFFGAIRHGAPAQLDEVASPEAAAAARPLAAAAPFPYRSTLTRAPAVYEADALELERWSALPSPRADAPAPVSGVIELRGAMPAWYLVELRHAGGGWRVESLRPVEAFE